MTAIPTWKAYERQIFAALKANVAADATVTFDDRGRLRLPGRFSGIDRQIDVLVEGNFAGRPQLHRMIVDCKAVARTLTVEDVEAFAGLLDDVNESLGLLVATSGFSEAAQRRAAQVRGMELAIVPLDQLSLWLPRNPALGHTTGTTTATLTYRVDGQGATESVPLDFANQLLTAIGRPPIGQRQPWVEVAPEAPQPSPTTT